MEASTMQERHRQTGSVFDMEQSHARQFHAAELDCLCDDAVGLERLTVATCVIWQGLPFLLLWRCSWSCV